MSKKLIAFYSRANENYFNGTLKTLEGGNTEVAAEIIRELTDADIFKIEQTKPYSKGYNNCITEAKADKQRNARPELKGYPDSLDGYDVICNLSRIPELLEYRADGGFHILGTF